MEKREMAYRQAFATIEGELYPSGEFFGVHHVEGWFRARVYFQGIKTEEDFVKACKRYFQEYKEY